MSDKRYAGENKFLLDEIYVSDLVEQKEDAQHLDTWRSYKSNDGKYHYMFPTLWYSNTCNNKAIAVRRIQTKSKATVLSGSIKYLRQYIAQGTVYFDPDTYSVSREEKDSYTEALSDADNINRSYPLSITVSPDDDIYVIGTRLVESLRYMIENSIESSSSAYKYISCAPSFSYDPVTYKFTLKLDNIQSRFREGGAFTHRMVIYITSGNEVIQFPANKEWSIYRGASLILDNVWDRRNIFVHASFVNGTSFQYLGRNGDFFPKPSKMWRFNGNSTEFELYLTQDGKKAINTKDVSFIVELTFIYSNSEYQAE